MDGTEDGRVQRHFSFFLSFLGGHQMQSCFILFLLIFLCHGLLMQGRSQQYSWSSFNHTTFQGNNHISANIHKFNNSAPGDSACIGPGNTSSLHHSIRVSYKLDPNDVIMTARYRPLLLRTNSVVCSVCSCTGCSDRTGCTGCTRCSGCTGCSGCSGLQWLCWL